MNVLKKSAAFVAAAAVAVSGAFAVNSSADLHAALNNQSSAQVNQTRSLDPNPGKITISEVPITISVEQLDKRPDPVLESYDQDFYVLEHGWKDTYYGGLADVLRIRPGSAQAGGTFSNGKIVEKSGNLAVFRWSDAGLTMRGEKVDFVLTQKWTRIANNVGTNRAPLDNTMQYVSDRGGIASVYLNTTNGDVHTTSGYFWKDRDAPSDGEFVRFSADSDWEIKAVYAGTNDEVAGGHYAIQFDDIDQPSYRIVKDGRTTYGNDSVERVVFLNGWMGDQFYTQENTNLLVKNAQGGIGAFATTNNVAEGQSATTQDPNDMQYDPSPNDPWSESILGVTSQSTATFRTGGDSTISTIIGPNLGTSQYPELPVKKKTVSSTEVAPGGDLEWTLEGEFPATLDQNKPQAIAIKDTLHDGVDAGSITAKVLNEDGDDDSAKFTQKVEGRTVTWTPKKLDDVAQKSFKFVVSAKAADAARVRELIAAGKYETKDKWCVVISNRGLFEVTDANGNIKRQYTNTVKTDDCAPGDGDLAVSKKVSSGSKAKEFTYTFKASGEGDVSTKEYSYDGSVSGKVKSGDSFKLKDGQSITIHDIPDDAKYEVVETVPEGWEQESAEGTTGTIVADDTAKASFVNKQLPGKPGAPVKTAQEAKNAAGGTANWTWTQDIPVGNYSAVSFEDIVDEHQEAVTNIVLKNGSATLKEGTDYTVSTSGRTVTITMSKAFVESLQEKAAKLVFTGSSKILDKAYEGDLSNTVTPKFKDVPNLPSSTATEKSVKSDPVKKVDITETVVGDVLTYTIDQTIKGIDNGYDSAAIIDTLPAGVSFKDGSATLTIGGKKSAGTVKANGQTVTATFTGAEAKSITKDTAVQLVFKARINTGKKGDILTNKVHSVLNGAESAKATAVTVLTDQNPTKNVDITETVVGDVLTYTLELPLKGLTEGYESVSLTDTLPANVTYAKNPHVFVGGKEVSDSTVTAKGQQVTFALSEAVAKSVTKDTSLKVMFDAKIGSGAKVGDVLVNTVEGMYNGVKTLIAEASTKVIGQNPDKGVDIDTSVRGGIVRWTVEMPLKGLKQGYDSVDMVDTLPAHVEYRGDGQVYLGNIRQSDATVTAKGNTLTFTLSEKAAKSVTADRKMYATFTTKVTKDAKVGEEIVNKVIGHYNGATTTEDTAKVTIIDKPTKKVVDIASTAVGDVLTYTVTQPIHGMPEGYDSIVVVDQLPAGTAFRPASAVVKVGDRVQKDAVVEYDEASNTATFALSKAEAKLMAKDATMTVTFDAKILAAKGAKPGDVLENTAFTNFNDVATTPSKARTELIHQDPAKKVDITETVAGDVLDYTITMPLKGLKEGYDELSFTDTLPANVAYHGSPVVKIGKDADKDAKVEAKGNTVTFTVSDKVAKTIKADTTATVTFKGKILGSVKEGDTLTNTVVGHYNGITTKEAKASTKVIAQHPTKKVDITETVAGDVLDYTLELPVKGLKEGYDSIVFTDTLPENVVFHGGAKAKIGDKAAKVSAKANGQTVTLAMDSEAIKGILRPNDTTVSVTFKAKILGSVKEGDVLKNVVKANYNGFDTKTATASTKVTAQHPTKKVSDAKAMPGSVITYTLELPAKGLKEGYDSIVFTDTLPAGVKYYGSPAAKIGDAKAKVSAKANGQNVTFTMDAEAIKGILRPNDTTVTVTFKAQLTDAIKDGEKLVNTVKANYNGFDTKEATAETTGVIKDPVKSVDNAVSLPGGILVYTLEQEIIGVKGGYESITFVDTLPEKVAYHEHDAHLTMTVDGKAVEGVKAEASEDGREVRIAVPAEVSKKITKDAKVVATFAGQVTRDAVEGDMLTNTVLTDINGIKTKPAEAETTIVEKDPVKSVDYPEVLPGGKLGWTVEQEILGQAAGYESIDVVDTLPAKAATFNEDLVVTLDGKELKADEDYVMSVEDGQLTVSLSEKLAASLKADTKLVLTFSTTADSEGVADGEELVNTVTTFFNGIETKPAEAQSTVRYFNPIKGVDTELAKVGDEVTYTVEGYVPNANIDTVIMTDEFDRSLDVSEAIVKVEALAPEAEEAEGEEVAEAENAEGEAGEPDEVLAEQAEQTEAADGEWTDITELFDIDWNDQKLTVSAPKGVAGTGKAVLSKAEIEKLIKDAIKDSCCKGGEDEQTCSEKAEKTGLVNALAEAGLPVGTTYRYTIIVKQGHPTADQQLTEDGEFFVVNNIAHMSTETWSEDTNEVTHKVPTPALIIEKSVDREVLEFGEAANYTVTVVNPKEGSVAADVKLVDVMDSKVLDALTIEKMKAVKLDAEGKEIAKVDVSLDTGRHGYEAAVATLEGGEKLVFTYAVRNRGAAGPAELHNVATVQARDIEPLSDEATVAIPELPAPLCNLCPTGQPCTGVAKGVITGVGAVKANPALAGLGAMLMLGAAGAGIRLRRKAA